MQILVKRVYEKPNSQEGLRILVDRLWPRGLSKDLAKIDVWIKSIAPSNELRRWYQHDTKKWPEFMEKYFAELDQNHDAVNELIHHIQRTKVVFLFGSKEIYNNNAVALKKYIEAILAK